MNSKYKLTDVREMWVRAYFNGETDWLDFLQTPTFFAKRGENFITKAEQLAFIDRNKGKFVAAKKSNNPAMELEKSIVEHNGWATVTGFYESTSDKGLSIRSSFLEVWVVIDARWQIASLCVDDYCI